VPNEPVEVASLASFGVLYFSVPLDDRATFIERLAKERSYKNRDEVGRARAARPSDAVRPR
jgi:cupin superfamily acireductone dioxygenase involved in methionine salvage